MSTEQKERGVFDPLLGELEAIIADNAGLISAQATEIADTLTDPIRAALPDHRSRRAQFDMIHRAIATGEQLFQECCADLPKEMVMAIARRAPESILEGADLLLATLVVKHTTPVAGASWSWSSAEGNTHAVALIFTPEQVLQVCRLMALARTMNHLRGMARWLGKGRRLIVEPNRTLRVEIPQPVREAVTAYERRRVRERLFDNAGFFAPQSDPRRWSNHRIPTLKRIGRALMIEAPAGSKRWLSFERIPSMMDGGGLASLLQGYDAALVETYGTGADTILHFLTALATLVHSESLVIEGTGEHLAFRPDTRADRTEHKIGFLFGLARKGFLRLPRAGLIQNIGRVRTMFAPDQQAGEALAAAFIDAFLVDAARTDIDAISGSNVPFLHASTEGHVYIDFLLLGDFLGGVIDKAKDWYASQHGDRFVLDLKRWLDTASPGAVVDARRPVTLSGGAKSDADLLLSDAAGLIVVECKAYSKSREFLKGTPEAIVQRRGRIRDAVRQARRTAQAFARDVAAGLTVWPADTPVRWLVCTPTAEYLLPLDEHGMASPGIPNVLTPEELLELLSRSMSGQAPMWGRSARDDGHLSSRS